MFHRNSFSYKVIVLVLPNEQYQSRQRHHPKFIIQKQGKIKYGFDYVNEVIVPFLIKNVHVRNEAKIDHEKIEG